MDDRCRTLADMVGQHIIGQHFTSLHGLFAPWLQLSTSAGDIEPMIVAVGAGLPAPQTFTVDESPIDLASLCEPDRYGPPTGSLPDDITAANYRGWLCVQFQPDPDNPDGFKACFDLWLAVVEHEGRYCVGYLEAAEAS